jgi:hypothetical protein
MKAFLESYNKFSELLAKKICYLWILFPLAGDFAALLGWVQRF